MLISSIPGLKPHNMSQYEVSMAVNMNHDMAGNPHYTTQQGLYVPNGASRIKSETGSERSGSPHNADQNPRYPSQTPNYNASLAQQLTNSLRYTSPSANVPQQTQQQQLNGLIPHSFPQPTPDQSYQQQQSPLGGVSTPPQQDQNPTEPGRSSTGGSGLPKAFACSTCAKGFARRSDLARHERIHSGVRPHVCDHPGCGKQFIQRSALTVHSRVHTGEKPHMCERCGKPFSDSSSLARHRRIHSGKRPYKCPYADCQKTFTRRTTLTRHQNHHTGTIEESAAATAAALASRQGVSNARSRASDEGDEYSTDSKSPMPQSNDNRQASVSPANAINGMPTMARQSSDYYMNAAIHGGMAAVPAHMRPEMQPSPRAQSPTQYQIPVTMQQQRPGLTSNPSSGYSNPPQIMEPAANGQAPPGSGNNSPHLGGAIGWQSPHNNMAAAQASDYGYADPNQGYAPVNATQMYYQPTAQQQARPHSTGPMDYAPMRGQEMWAQHQQ